jgi:ribosome-binding factor A
MHRMDKVNHQIQKEISIILQQELGDPRLKFVTITKAEVSRDLKFAKISFSVLGNNQKLQDAKKGLDKAKGLIRKFVGERMKMRYIPELSFMHDRSLEYSARIDETLKEIHHDLTKDSSND